MTEIILRLLCVCECDWTQFAKEFIIVNRIKAKTWLRVGYHYTNTYCLRCDLVQLTCRAYDKCTIHFVIQCVTTIAYFGTLHAHQSVKRTGCGVRARARERERDNVRKYIQLI